MTSFPASLKLVRISFKRGFPLAGVAKDQDIAGGLILAAPVKVHQDIGAILIPAQVDTTGIGLAGKVKGVQVGYGAGGQHTLELRPELIGPHRQNRKISFLLPEGEPVNRDFGSSQLHSDL